MPGKGYNPDELRAIGQTADADDTRPLVLTAFGAHGAILEARGILTVTSDPSPRVGPGEIVTSDDGDRFTVQTVEADPSVGIVETETPVVDVGNEWMPVQGEVSATETTPWGEEQPAPQAEDVQTAPPQEASITSGDSTTDVEVAPGDISLLPVGGSETTSVPMWDEGLQDFVNVLLHFDGSGFEVLG